MADKLTPLQEELLKRADSIFISISDNATKVADFAKEQLPDIAYQFIAYNKVYYTSLTVTGFLFILLAFWLFIYVLVLDKFKMYSSPHDTSGIFAITLLSTIVSAMIGIPMFLSTFKSTLMVWFAPKIFLITSIVELVKK